MSPEPKAFGPPTNKDSRSFRPSSLAEINARNKYRPLVFRYTKKDGSPGECNLGCGNSLEDLVIIITAYVTGYCFLVGLTILMLRGCLDTSETSVLLWAFFFFGIIFVALVVGAVYVGFLYLEREKEEKRKATKEAEKALLAMRLDA